MVKRARNSRRRWSEEDVKYLMKRWGETDSGLLAKRLGRSREAIRFKAYSLGLGPCSQGTLTISEVSKRTGYCVEAIKTIARTNGIRLRKSLKGSINCRYVISDDVYNELLEVMKRTDGIKIHENKMGEWGKKNKPERCLCCGTNKIGHQSRGLCHNCYQRLMRHKKLDRYKRLNRRKSNGN